MLEADTNSDWADRTDDTAAVPVVPTRRHHVSAVVVSHNGSRWLPATVRGLRAQSRSVDAVIAVDTGSTDNSADIVVEAFGEEWLVTAPVETAFGNAAARGISRVHDVAAQTDVDVSWFWLFHDDAAPAPDALEELLTLADIRPDAGVIGPKIVGWHDHTLLMEIGLSITGGGRRETFLERREHDQGQHDSPRDVLAVGSAGILIRKDVWDSLGGFDPHLAMFRDDIDFCMRARRAGWSVIFCGEATVYHAEAGAHGRRELHAVFDRPHMIDRLSAMHVVLIHWPLWLLPALFLRMILGSAGRVVAFLLGRDPLAAADEVAGVGLALAKINAVFESRRALKQIATVTRAAALRPFLPTAADAWRHAMDVVGEVVDLATEGRQFTSGAGVRHTPTTPLRQSSNDDDVEQAMLDEPDGRKNVMLRWLRRPSVVMVLLLAVGALVGERSLFGSGPLQGGALLAVPDRAAVLWSSYVSEWHDVGVGSTLQSPPYLAIIAMISVIFGGASSLTVTLLLVLGIPGAALSAAWALRPWVDSALLRAMAGAVYSLLPAMTGAALTGRIGTIVLGIVLPWVIRSWITVLHPSQPPTGRRVWATGLLMAVGSAFVPLVWLVTAVFLLAFYTRSRERLAAVLTVMVTSLALLLPWSLRLFKDPSLWLREAGRTNPTILDPLTSPLDVLLLNPGGPGTSYVMLPVIAAGVFALGRRATRERVKRLWAVAVIPAVMGMLQTFVGDMWSGPATLMAGAALIVMCAVAVDGLLPRLSRMSFTWKQVIVSLLLVSVSISTLTAWSLWLRGSNVVSRESDQAVPAFVKADLASLDQPRVLILRRDPDGSVRYEIRSHRGPILGDADVLPRSTPAAIESAISDLAAGRGGQEMRTLSSFAIRYVVTPDQDAQLAARLDSAAGLRRLAGESGGLWESAYPTALLRLVPSENANGVSVDPALPLPPVTGSAPALLWGQPDDGRWVATLDGAILPSVTTEAGSLQWQLPGSFAGSSLAISRDGGGHTVGIIMQMLIFALVVVMSLPRRREDDLQPDAEGEMLVMPS